MCRSILLPPGAHILWSNPRFRLVDLSKQVMRPRVWGAPVRQIFVASSAYPASSSASCRYP